MNLPEFLNTSAAKHPYPLMFATVSGAHLYGFPSPDSDYDLRGAHILPLEDVVGFDPGEQTLGSITYEEGIELDLVTHDIKKFFGLMLKKNGYVLEQLFSPLVVYGSPEFEELKQIGISCITKHHSHHYTGFARNQWRLFQKQNPPRVKALLYVFRVLLTGINLMEEGVIEANIVTLNRKFGLSYIPELADQKVTGSEKVPLAPGDIAFFEHEYQRLMSVLQEKAVSSTLPETTDAKPRLNDLLKRARLKTSTTR